MREYHHQNHKQIQRYIAAAAYLPVRLRNTALKLPDTDKAIAEEFRLRVEQPFTVLLPQGEQAFSEVTTPEDLETLCNLATDFSRYAATETIREGFVPVRGGFRVGLCGTAVMKDGCNTNLKYISSASIRISREQRGIGEDLAKQLFQNHKVWSTLLISPPGGGKTTLLRDLIRCLSTGAGAELPQRVVLIDERGEVAVMARGIPQMDIGPHTDVLDGCPKALGIPIVLRAMNPQVIALDEISLQEDLRAVTMAAGCGAALLATVHAENIRDLRHRRFYRELLDSGIFRLAIRIRCTAMGRQYFLEEIYPERFSRESAETSCIYTDGHTPGRTPKKDNAGKENPEIQTKKKAVPVTAFVRPEKAILNSDTVQTDSKQTDTDKAGDGAKPSDAKTVEHPKAGASKEASTVQTEPEISTDTDIDRDTSINTNTNTNGNLCL